MIDQSHSAKSQAENKQGAEPMTALKMTGEVGEKQDSKYLESGGKQGGVEPGKPHVAPQQLSSADEDAAGKVYPPMREVIPVMVAVFMALFLVSLVGAQMPS